MSTSNQVVDDQYKFYASKSFDIFYISFLYISISYYPAVYLDHLFTTIFSSSMSKKNAAQLLFEIVFQVSLTGVVAYILRNIVVRIPSPFHGVAGLDHFKVKELNSGAVMFTFLLALQSNLQKKIVLLRDMS